MDKIRIPNTDLDVSVLCMGTSSYGTGVKDGEADRLTTVFLEAGGNFFDTAHCYSFWEPNGLGTSERELGASLRRLGVAGQVVVATKGGHPDGGKDYPRPADFLAEAVIVSDIEESLNRLEMATIDLYYLHRDDGRTPVGEIMETLNREITRGRVRFLGASNWTVERMAEANAYADAKGLQGFVVSQIQGSLAVPKWQMGADPTNRYLTEAEMTWHTASGVPIACYSATASGYFAETKQGVGGYDSPENQQRRERATALATGLGCTPTQVAVAYLRHLGPTVFPLFGTTNTEHLAEIVASTEIVLTAEQARWLREG